MKRNETAIIVLGSGKGERFGALKQFLRINGKMLLTTVVNTVLGYNLGRIVVLVVPQDKVLFTRQLYKKNLEVVVLSGGSTRSESTKIALEYLRDKNINFVFVHDAVRPFITKGDFLHLKTALLTEGTDGAVLFLPITDSVVLVSDKNNQIAHLDNSSLRATQTPHLYRYKTLAAIFASTDKKLENAELMESSGYKLSYVPGSRTNIKLTYKADLLVFKQWLK